MTKAITACLFFFCSLTGEGQSVPSNTSGGVDSAIGRSNQHYIAARRSGNADSLFSSLVSMFNLYLELGDYAKCFDYADQLYNIAMSSGKPERISKSLVSLGKLYQAIGDYPHALNYYSRAMAMFTSAHSGVRSDQLLLPIAEVYAHTAQFDSAGYYYDLYLQNGNRDSAAFRVSTGECFFMQGKYLRSLENYQWAIRDPEKKTDPRTLLGLASVFAVLGKADVALPYAKEGLRKALATGTGRYIRDGYKIISDIYEQTGHADSSNAYFRKYSVARDIVFNAQTRGRMAAMTYEQEISRMNQENEIREVNLQKQVLIRNGLLAGILLILLSAFLFSRYLMAKRRSEVRQRQVVQSELTIQKLESEKANAELEKQKSELEIRALRAQMNPHFIFNCLNSINRFIIGNEAAKAADYLTKFARLIRIVLEKSSSPTITLEEELQTLKLYMDLEALRFEIPFQYEIESADIDTEEWMVPSLIIQPFVENAIWHGFQAGQSRQGRIRIELRLENDRLQCRIMDNGLGISHSKEINRVHSHSGKSLGIKFTTERLRLAGHSTSETVIRVGDLKDENGKIIGTVVSLVIPVAPV